MKTRERILHTARNLFNQKGWSRITTNHIAAEMGISPGNLYYHFQNKEEIVREIFEEWVGSFDLLWQREEDRLAELSALAEIVDRSCELFYDYRFFYMELTTILARDPELSKRYLKNRKLRFKDIAYVISHIESLGLTSSPLSEEERESLINIFWTNSEFIISAMYIYGDAITAESIKKRLIQLGFIFKPYLKKEIWQGLMDLVNPSLNK